MAGVTLLSSNVVKNAIHINKRTAAETLSLENAEKIAKALKNAGPPSAGNPNSAANILRDVNILLSGEDPGVAIQAKARKVLEGASHTIIPLTSSLTLGN